MRIGARNTPEGTVKSAEHGAVNSEVTVGLKGGAEVVSVIAKESAERSELTPGGEVYAVVKASDVMVAVD